MPGQPGDGSPDRERLTAIGLPPRPLGWVPDEPAVPSPPAAAEAVPRAPEPVLPSRVDLARLSVADWLPGRLGEQVRAISPAGFVVAVAAVLALAIGGAVYLHDRHRSTYSDSYSSSFGTAGSTSSPTAASAGYPADGSSIVVDVGGAVRRPGLVTLPVGARVADAVAAAGGPLHPGELARTNLAARVTDGELLLIAAHPGRGGGSASGGLISLSTASLAKLETLPGVGPVTAQKIIDWRNAHGGFTSVEQLQQVSGIGPSRYAELAPLVAP